MVIKYIIVMAGRLRMEWLRLLQRKSNLVEDELQVSVLTQKEAEEKGLLIWLGEERYLVLI